jgi:hypothetical protein
MRYALLIYGDEAGWEAVDEATRQEMYGGYERFAAWLEERGWMRGGEELSSSKTATTVRVRGGETLTLDGPFAETKEQLGGFFLIECEDLDQAIEAASRIPGVRDGSIEVRPLAEQGEEHDH